MSNGKSDNPRGFLLYRIFYRHAQGEQLVYVGKTTQALRTRMKQHFTADPVVKKLNPALVSHIDYAQLATRSDLAVAEIYWINYAKPPLNEADKYNDKLNFILPMLSFIPWSCRDKLNEWARMK